MTGLLDAPLSGVLDVIGQLVECVHGCNGYGGKVAEIYEYTLERRDPVRELARGREGGFVPPNQAAADALTTLCQWFAARHNVQVWVENELVADGERPCSRIVANGHRYHVEVGSR
jgi:hypothetical protein